LLNMDVPVSSDTGFSFFLSLCIRRAIIFTERRPFKGETVRRLTIWLERGSEKHEAVVSGNIVRMLCAAFAVEELCAADLAHGARLFWSEK